MCYFNLFLSNIIQKSLGWLTLTAANCNINVIKSVLMAGESKARPILTPCL